MKKWLCLALGLCVVNVFAEMAAEVEVDEPAPAEKPVVESKPKVARAQASEVVLVGTLAQKNTQKEDGSEKVEYRLLIAEDEAVSLPIKADTLPEGTDLEALVGQKVSVKALAHTKAEGGKTTYKIKKVLSIEIAAE